jgi:glycine reductase
MLKKVVFYTNQFFGQIGGEDKAYTQPQFHNGPVGSANAFADKLVNAEIVATIICGDNYYVENMDDAKKFIREKLNTIEMDLMIAGPAFNAGRFGIACSDVCSFVKEEFNVEAITGLYEENPAVEMYKKNIYILKVGSSAAAIRKAVPLMSSFANKLLNGENIGGPKEEQYFAKGKRVNVFKEKNGAERAVEMLLNRLHNEPYETELEISVYEKVNPALPIQDLTTAKIALCTTGGIVPYGNPDHIPAASAKIYKMYDIANINRLDEGDFESVHAGYDPVYANKDPNRVAPLDVLRKLENEGKIGSVYDYLTTTTGNSASVSDSARMGKEIAEIFLKDGVKGVILTST